jgi:hypothetical protein
MLSELAGTGSNPMYIMGIMADGRVERAPTNPDLRQDRATMCLGVRG